MYERWPNRLRIIQVKKRPTDATGMHGVTFPTVKTTPYGIRRPAQARHLWSEAYWRLLVHRALAELVDDDLRVQLMAILGIKTLMHQGCTR